MKLTNKAIEALSTTANRMRLALAMDCSEAKVRRDLIENCIDSDLTKISVIKAIEEITGLTESEILEAQTQTA